MGFFDKVKAFKNAITGGGADVHVFSSKAELGDDFEINITAEINDADLNVNRVYIQIEGIEEVEVPYTVDIAKDIDEENGSKTKKDKIARSSISTYENEIEIANAQNLSANERYEWTIKTSLPKDGLPVYKGTNCNHSYRVIAYLDCRGNDPDSGWKTIDIK